MPGDRPEHGPSLITAPRPTEIRGKLRNLASIARNEPLPNLIREAGWRGIRSIRKSIFTLTGRAAIARSFFIPSATTECKGTTSPSTAARLFSIMLTRSCAGSIRCLGIRRPAFGTTPDWQCDWVSGKSWPIEASGKLPIVRHDGSDVKAPWELSRLQFGPVAAKAYVLTNDSKYRGALRSLLTDWIERNPIGRGANWTVAMEAALRGISLCLTMELLWPFTTEESPWLDQITGSLWQHLYFIEAHIEFSLLRRSNHYLSNLIGLTTLSAYLRDAGWDVG